MIRAVEKSAMRSRFLRRIQSRSSWNRHIVARIIALALLVLLVGFVSAAWAGGGYFEAPVVNGYCRPFMAPPKPLKRMYSFDELNIRLGKIKVTEVKKFQVNHCFEYDEVERGKIIREYVESEEWYR